MSIEVTVRDTETGDTETATITNDYVIVCAGTCHVATIQDYPTKGTRVITVKGRLGRGMPEKQSSALGGDHA
jgi:hypothetical protein